MIVRIMGEGQLELSETHLPELNKLDDDLLAELESADEQAFRRTLTALLNEVRRLGTPLPPDALHPSDLIFPGPDFREGRVR
uniref:PspA-associated protein PspAA n=1 Tax=Streptomyces niveiscabiei TaxID=164115 RepID=UPI0006EBDEEF